MHFIFDKWNQKGVDDFVMLVEDSVQKLAI
jgi:hypothetical protein